MGKIFFFFFLLVRKIPEYTEHHGQKVCKAKYVSKFYEFENLDLLCNSKVMVRKGKKACVVALISTSRSISIEILDITSKPQNS